MQVITTTIKREWLREIIAGRKKTEYRELKPYWSERLAGVTTPFLLRLINGMQSNAPEVTVIVQRVRKNVARNRYELSLFKILNVRNWDKRREQPTMKGNSLKSR